MTAVQPVIWYKFDPANPTLNSGTFGPAGNLTLYPPEITVVANTDLSGQSGCLRIVPTSGTRTTDLCVCPSSVGLGYGSDSNVQFAISFWFKNLSSSPVNLMNYFSYFRSSTDAFGGRTNTYRICIRDGVLREDVNSLNWAGTANTFDGNWHHCYYRMQGGNAYRGLDNARDSQLNFQALLTATMSDMILGGDRGVGRPSLNGYLADVRVYALYYNATYPISAFDSIYKIGINTNVASLSTVPAYALIHANASYAQLLVAGYTLTTLLGSPNNYTVVQLYAIGATIAQLRAQRTILQLIAEGITIDNLLAASYSYTQLIDNEFVRRTQFISAGKTIPNLVTGGVTFPKLITAGYTIQQIAAVPYTFTQILDGGITPSQFTSASPPYTYFQLVSGNVLISRLLTESVTFSQMIAGGVTSTQFTAQSYSIVNLKNGGATDTQLSVAGYTFEQFQTEGILPAWNIDMSANHIIKSYVKDFIDVSGSVVLRENSNLYIHGNAELAGSLSLNRLAVEADASFNRRIFVGGDVSMNGSLFINGDLSMNGSVTKCNLNNSSIPKSAFAGAVPDGPDYNTSRIVYGQTFQANDDVSMNGATIAANNVTVSGNIIFGDGTVMNAYDNNISTTNPPAFKPSTFTALDICGNLVAGSYATSSDYRIKTNIVELDETYNVDKLRPVKYYQTQINREKYGLIAHELQEHYPDLVIGEKDGTELQRVNYTGLIAILINDIKRLKRELEVLELQHAQ